jgi:hypothetical protein
MPTATADPMEVEAFLDLIRNGSAERVAALSVGWTPHQLRALKADPEFLELCADAFEYFLDNVETTVATRALAGNRWAAEMVLYNRRPDYWRPPAHKVAIEHSGTVSHDVVVTAVEAARALILEKGAIAALQQGAIEASASD